MHQHFYIQYLPISSDCCKGYWPETSYIFLLLRTGICLVLFYINPIVPHAPAFLHSFLLLVTVIKGIGLKRHLYV